MGAKTPSFTINLHLHYFSLAITYLLFIPCLCSTVSAIRPQNHHDDQLGFTVDLIHRDSPKSPFYNPSESPSDRFKNALIRSRSRLGLGAKKISPNSPPTQSTLLSNRVEYLMEIALGTPRARLLAIADTGSDITWTQCAPCQHCYNQTGPLFAPNASTTYRGVSCFTSHCASIAGKPCFEEQAGEPCEYLAGYADGSYSKGIVGTDTLELGSVAFPGFGFGCGLDNEGSYDARGSGIVGLGNGEASLVRQLGDSIDHKFSYCLVPFTSNSSGKINFGSTAVVSGPGTVSVPLLPDSYPETFYYFRVNTISVGNKTFKAQYDSTIDSGTALTIVPTWLYDQVESELVKSIPLERIADPTGLLNLCYKSPTAEPGHNFPAPNITFNLGPGVDLQLGSFNTFVRVSDEVVCFALYGDLNDVPLIGNWAQMNFLVGYDLKKRTLSFKPTDCTKN